VNSNVGITMSPQMVRTLYWLPGPLLAVSLLAFTVLGRAGPGFAIFSAIVGLALMVAAPLIQLALLATSRFGGRYGAACLVAIASVLVVAGIPLVLGVFNFW
jgi:hypothetical protein